MAKPRTASRLIASAAVLTVIASILVPPVALAQTDNIATNSIAITKIVTGESPAAVAPFKTPDGRPGYFFTLDCTPTIEGQPGAHGQTLVVLDPGATSGTMRYDVSAVLNRDEGAVECTVSEDAPASSAVAGLPTVGIDLPGQSRAADPSTDPVTVKAEANMAIVRFPYTRRDAIAHVTFTNAYAIAAAPNFTG